MERLISMTGVDGNGLDHWLVDGFTVLGFHAQNWMLVVVAMLVVVCLWEAWSR